MLFRAGIRPLISQVSPQHWGHIPVPTNAHSQREQEADSQLLPVTLLAQPAKVAVENLNDHKLFW